jgi:hypothetical protein
MLVFMRELVSDKKRPYCEYTTSHDSGRSKHSIITF